MANLKTSKQNTTNNDFDLLLESTELLTKEEQQLYGDLFGVEKSHQEKIEILNEIKQSIKKVSNEILLAQDELVDKTDQFDLIKKKTSEKEKEASALADSNIAFSKMILTLQDEYNRKKKRIDELNLDLVEMRGTWKKLSSAQEQLNNEINAIKNELAFKTIIKEAISTDSEYVGLLEDTISSVLEKNSHIFAKRSIQIKFIEIHGSKNSSQQVDFPKVVKKGLESAIKDCLSKSDIRELGILVTENKTNFEFTVACASKGLNSNNVTDLATRLQPVNSGKNSPTLLKCSNRKTGDTLFAAKYSYSVKEAPSKTFEGTI